MEIWPPVRKKIFEGFSPYMGLAAILFMWPGSLEQIRSPYPRRLYIKEGRALSPFFGPHWKPKIKSYFTTLSLDWFIRWLIQVFLFHIDSTLTVAMVTENGRYNRLKSKKLSFWAKIGRFNRQVNIEHKQIPKWYLNGWLMVTRYIKYEIIFLVFSCADI